MKKITSDRASGLIVMRGVCQYYSKGNQPARVLSDVNFTLHRASTCAIVGVSGSALILADEPTGNLDRKCAIDVMDLLLGLNQQHDVTLVMVTHDTVLAERFERRIEVIEGQLLDRSIHAAA